MRGLSPLRCFGAIGYCGTQGKMEDSLKQIKIGVARVACIGLEVSYTIGSMREAEREGVEVMVHRY